jgi:hypothetical protein
MATKKASAKQEPLLNAVARTLGHAAGTLTKVAQDFTENLSELPDAVTAKMQQVANTATLTKASQTRSRRVKKRTPRAASQMAVKKNLAKGGKGKLRRSKSSQSRKKSSTRHR